MAKANVVETVSSLLQAVRLEKQAAEKGMTTHPSKNVDNGTVASPEGERGRENTADIKKDVGSTTGIAGQEDANSADASKPSDSIGTQSQASDEVKGNVPTPKTAPEKPGQGGQGDASPEHPTSKTFGEKYSSAMDLGNKILASIAVASAEKKAEGEAPMSTAVATTIPSKKKVEKETAAEEKKEEASEAKKAEAQLEKDAEAGYTAAAALYEALTKKAAGAEQSEEVINKVIKAASADAKLFCEFLKGYEDGVKEASGKENQEKRAQVEQIGAFLWEAKEKNTLTSELLKRAADELSGLSGQQVSPEDLQAMMSGGGGGGNMSPEGEVVGEVGENGAEGEIDPQIQAIAEELAAAGVTPEELVQALSQEEGGAPEAEMGGGGAPEEAAAHEATETPAEEKKEEESKKEGSAKAASVQELAKKLLAARTK